MTEIIADLWTRITQGMRHPGGKLLTKPQFSAEFGVSRTVIREAVAALRTEGLLQPRQGSGVFVLSPTRSDHGTLTGVDTSRLSSILSLLELCIAVETEAAALAAQGCSPEQEE